MLSIVARRGTTKPDFVDVPPPADPAAGEVLCRTLELGVCGTDREILHSAKPWTPAGGDYLVLGHECLARIEAVGDGVTRYQSGDLVVPVVRRPLGSPQRRVDLLPFGTFVERGIVWEHGFSQPLWIDRPEHLFAVPDEIADLAVLTEPLAVSEKGANEALAVTRARLGEGVWTTVEPPRVLVTGMGPIGFTAVLAAAARGWPVTMLGRDEPGNFRARLVERLGGKYQQLGKLEMSPADVEADGYDLRLGCTGSDELLIEAAGLIRSCGVIVWLGSSRVPTPKPLNVERLVRDGLLRNHIHIGSVNTAPRDFNDALRHLAELANDRRADLAALITARTRPEDALWHYEHRQPQGIKTVVVMEE